MEKETLSTVHGFLHGSFDCRSSCEEGDVGRLCLVAQLVRTVDRQSKDPGSNPDTVERVSFSTERFLIL